MPNFYSPPAQQRICPYLLTPYLMTAYLVEVMRQHFASADQIVDPGLTLSGNSFVWTNDNTTGIAIDSISNWSRTVLPNTTSTRDFVEKRPGIIVKGHSWKNVRLGIANRLQGAFPSDGSQPFSSFWAGSHTLFCLAGAGAECQKLAAEVFNELLQFEDVIRNDIGLMRFQVAEVGELTLLEEAKQRFVVPITVAYVSQVVWSVTQQAPPLRRVDLSNI